MYRSSVSLSSSKTYTGVIVGDGVAVGDRDGVGDRVAVGGGGGVALAVKVAVGNGAGVIRRGVMIIGARGTFGVGVSRSICSFCAGALRVADSDGVAEALLGA
ncbi:MAG: hypothetical protein H5T69_15860 [Chloroflexi bacterium]|nr:hypothetical protein [Chloroflexota bacterium]